MRRSDPKKFAAKKLEILRAAGRCFERSGFDGASISQICTEAGISPGHLYHYFPSKEAIVEGIVAAALDRVSSLFDGLTKRKNLISALLDTIEEAMKPGDMQWPIKNKLSLDIKAEARRNPVIAKALARHNESQHHMLSMLLREAQLNREIDITLNVTTAADAILCILAGIELVSFQNIKNDTAPSWYVIRPVISRYLKFEDDTRKLNR